MRRSENEERRKLEEESSGGGLGRGWEGRREGGGNKSGMGERGETMARSGREGVDRGQGGGLREG